ncbi:hypothetical protein FHX15_000924 [Rhizobium sp. BK650]|uniref:hypothetical protein n=1 Tax=Rhizobium sp. BK650 TaxID=2586990 RepID=UPI00160864A9|nr:hypothetical protein [Rhizobium sp. BK650]MBB3655711.1 hypothetical protein [Rhizobium sp. BK650]
MSNLPIDELRQDDDFERNPVGSYWTPPIPVSVHELTPAVRAALSMAIGSGFENMGQFELHLAHAFDMETCAPMGTFVVASGEASDRACGVYSVAGDMSAKEPMWFAFEQDIDLALKALYDRVRERGYLA